MGTTLGKYIKTATCNCGWFEKIWSCEVCPECGNEDIPNKVGRFEYRETWLGDQGKIIGFKLKEDDNE